MDTVKSFDALLEELTQAIDDEQHEGSAVAVSTALGAVTERFDLVVQLFRGAMAVGSFSEVVHATVTARMRELGIEMPASALAVAAVMTTPTPAEIARGHVVRTCCAIVDDVEGDGVPSIPKGTYGVDLNGDGQEYTRVNFGPPWGIQFVGNHVLVDAPAVLANARRVIVHKRRPWRNVIRRTLRTFAGPYLLVAAGRLGFYGDEEMQRGGSTWPVEAYLYKHGTKRKALALLGAAYEEAQGAKGTGAREAMPARRAPGPWTPFQRELEAIAEKVTPDLAQALRVGAHGRAFFEQRFRDLLWMVLGWEREQIDDAVRRARGRRS